MRTSLRLFTAAVTTAVAAAFLVIVPSATPAAAQTGFAINQVNIGSATVSEASATITFTVTLDNRVGGAVSATLKTQDVTAEAGKDYTFTQETLSWTALETAPKQFTVPIINDTVREPSEQFQVIFASAPSGSGASAGTIGTGTITDNEVGAVPQITVTPTGANSFPEGTGGDNF
ncbi:MAG: Calx-beta domain-containing protein, partial [Acidimicrobiales bacterium]|nr:Calx-beta domain-containing protein [Acidimicrobiales bacterium]